MTTFRALPLMVFLLLSVVFMGCPFGANSEDGSVCEGRENVTLDVEESACTGPRAEWLGEGSNERGENCYCHGMNN